MEASNSSSGLRRVTVLRHGERMDLTFGNSWISENYVRADLNMPESLPARDHTHWAKDSPLTKMGEYQASLVGSAFKDSGIKFQHVIVSPAYRCLQTATNVLKAMGSAEELPLKIEYGLFEWIGFYKDNLPEWLTEREAGKIFNINEGYEPVISRDEYLSWTSESLDDIYDFNSRATMEVLKKYQGNVLIVAHGGNLETCTREISGKPKRPWSELKELLAKVPYLGVMSMEQMNDSSYKLIEPPCPRLTHGASPNFDWKVFDDDLAPDPEVNESQMNIINQLVMKLDQ